MRLNVYQNHLSLITDFEEYCSVYQCAIYDELSYKRKNHLRHCRTCKPATSTKFPGGVFKPQETIFEKLAMIGITVPMQDRHYPYFACFDFECYFDTANLPKNEPKFTFEARHFVLSFAISSNVQGFEAGVCHVTDGDETALISKIVSCREDISDAANAIQTHKFDYVFEAFNTNQNCKCKNLQKEFEQYLRKIPVIGFNSSSYDLQLILKS